MAVEGVTVWVGEEGLSGVGIHNNRREQHGESPGGQGLSYPSATETLPGKWRDRCEPNKQVSLCLQQVTGSQVPGSWLP